MRQRTVKRCALGEEALMAYSMAGFIDFLKGVD
jgi:hypothetical protein